MSLTSIYNTPKNPITINLSSQNFLTTTKKKSEMWEEYEFFKVYIRIRDFSNTSKHNFIIKKFNNSMIRVLHGKEFKDFTFDYIFDEYESTKSIFTTALQPNLEGLFQGYNSTTMAYGMTGSGKTYTMLGEINNISIIDQNPGLIFLAVKDIFWKIHLEIAMDKNWDFTLKLSYLEIYNEQIRDLIGENQINLQILEDPLKGPIVQGLQETTIKNPQEIIELINLGNEKRVVAETSSNKFSSRSHAILTLTLQKKHRINEPNKITHAKLVMADLAGSERACVSENKGLRMMEGGNINKSLLALGNCIKMLSEKASKVNYRDSKLTRLLKESLGGNTRTIMLACLSPLESHYEESLNTLKYAKRMKQIKVKMSKNYKEETMDMETIIKLHEEHKMNSINSFSNNLMLNLQEIIDINNTLKSLKDGYKENKNLLEVDNLSVETRTGIEKYIKNNNMIIQNLEVKFQEKCKEKESLFMKLMDQLGVNSMPNDHCKDLQILKLNKEIEKLKSQLKEKNKLLLNSEYFGSPNKSSTQDNFKKTITSEKKLNNHPIYPKTISEIRKYYKTRANTKFTEDFGKFSDLKKQKKFNEKKKNHGNSICKGFTEKKLPLFITKYQDFKAVYQGGLNFSSNKKPLPISDMSSINNEQMSIDSFIFDKDIDEHDNGVIELKNFIKKDSKLKGKKYEKLGTPLKSLNTTNQLNLTGKLFNEGYYSEEIENTKGRRKMYESVRDLIQKQQEHLKQEYQKLQKGSNLTSLLEIKTPNPQNTSRFFIDDKPIHS